jgi:lipopolysaccharide transport system permease protein
MQDNTLSLFIAGCKSWRLWMLLGWLDIRQRYARSTLGPFWITLSMGVMVGSIGLVYGTLFGQNMKDYLPLVGTGFVIWGLISGTLNDSCFAFINNANFIRQSDASLWVYVFQVVWRQLIMLAHNIIIVVVLRFAFGIGQYQMLLFFIPGLALLLLNLTWMAQLAATWSARFRDIPQLIASLVQILFYITPLMWWPRMLTKHQWLLTINPFTNLVDLVRAPLLGTMAQPQSWVVGIGLAVVGWTLVFITSSRTSRNVAYWI